jgi:tetratricopeptide (TPR) repeat protein
MATKKQETETAEEKARAASEHLAFEAARAEYQAAFELLHKGEYTEAKERFLGITKAYPHESEMVERSRTYARICDQRMQTDSMDVNNADECYYRAVILANEGKAEEAVSLLDRALVQDPTSVRVLYARACAWALQKNAERAVSDLRSAISVDPTVRFQAANDTDFELIREEPAFIDVIEPTPAGS